MKIGIIGAGLQAERIGPIISNSKNSELISITSQPLEPAIHLSEKLDCKVEENWMKVLESEIDAVAILTPPNLHAEISVEAMKKGIHVFCEKPISNTLDDALTMIKTAEQNNIILKIGFNHRFHSSIIQIKNWIDNGKIGEIKFIRSVYGIGARPKIKNEWRSDPKLVAGGQLFEQGIHCIDLMRWFLGNPIEVSCLTSNPYSIIEPLEDSAFVIFRTSKGQLANIHSSVLQWKNQFLFEVFGTDGYVIASGLGGSYGVEKAIYGKRDPIAPFEEKIIEYRGKDLSWKNQWSDFEKKISSNDNSSGNGNDAYESLRLVLAAYQSNQEKRVIDLENF